MGSDEPEVKKTILTLTTILTVGCWNVRTLFSAGALKLLNQELQHFKWDIVRISETHWEGADDIREGEFRMISSGGENGNRAGVGILMNERASRALIESRPVGDRIITA